MHLKEKIVPLKLDLRVNNTVIRDQFLWDISNLESDPEEFARTLCKDLDIEDPEVGGNFAYAFSSMSWGTGETFRAEDGETCGCGKLPGHEHGFKNSPVKESWMEWDLRSNRSLGKVGNSLDSPQINVFHSGLLQGTCAVTTVLVVDFGKKTVTRISFVVKW
ncbi:Chromatin structure-remodeling complex protein BSH [Platanthera guangdongensis]|uniref:Chromatin structure-remodeling complex protein BSH n=1 Tax=Platanthera guangdongensis TaxID=2320717 RepID=A0ABR2MQF8_9ASPA